MCKKTSSLSLIPCSRSINGNEEKTWKNGVQVKTQQNDATNINLKLIQLMQQNN